MVKLSAFADEISPDLKEQMDALEKEDIHHIELRGVWNKGVLKLTDRELDMIAGALDRRGFKISSIGSPIGKVRITDDFDAHLKDFKRALKIARFFGTEYIRVFSFFIPGGDDPTLYRDEVMTRLKVMTEMAQEKGIILLHENEKEIYGDTGERCKDILDTVASPFLRATFDPANFVQVGLKPYRDCFTRLKNKVEYVHIKDALLSDGRVVPAGEGDGDVRQILTELIERGYTGFLSLEPHLEIAGRSGGFTGPEAFAGASRALKAILNEIGVEYR